MLQHPDGGRGYFNLDEAGGENIVRQLMKSAARAIAKYPKATFFCYMVISMWPFFFIRAEFNAPFALALKYLALPILLICWCFGWRYRSEFLASCKRRSTFWISMIALPPIAVLWSGGIVLQVNALVPPQREFLVDGVVLAKSISGAKSTTWIVDVELSEGTRRFEVSRREFEAAKVGEGFRQRRIQGPLGFSYVWK